MKLSYCHIQRVVVPLALLAAITAHAQLSLGTINYEITNATRTDSAVKGSVDFSYTSGNLTLTTTIINTKDNRLSGLYILKPFDFGGTTSTYNPEGYAFAGSPFGYSVTNIVGGEDDWSMTNNSQDAKHEFYKGFDDLVAAVTAGTMSSSTAQTIAANRTDYKNYYVGVEADDYYATNENRLRKNEGIEVEWSFAVGSLATAQTLVSNYTSSEWPLIFGRWNTLTSSCTITTWAKGWTTADIIIVPEPSTVGFLGFIFPLGLLVSRRRRNKSA